MSYYLVISTVGPSETMIMSSASLKHTVEDVGMKSHVLQPGSYRFLGDFMADGCLSSGLDSDLSTKAPRWQLLPCSRVYLGSQMFHLAVRNHLAHDFKLYPQNYYNP